MGLIFIFSLFAYLVIVNNNEMVCLDLVQFRLFHPLMFRFYFIFIAGHTSIGFNVRWKSATNVDEKNITNTSPTNRSTGERDL